VAEITVSPRDPTTLEEHLERAGYVRSLLVRCPRRWPKRCAPPRPVGRPRHAVRLPVAVRLDLGGTAEGLPADLAAELLAGHNCHAVDVGGDTASAAATPWPAPFTSSTGSSARSPQGLTLTIGAVAPASARPLRSALAGK
jgi:FAD:protein FMN transferase